MVRTLIGILLLVFGAGSVLWNNRTDLSSISQAEWIALVVCLLLAAVLLLWNQLAALLHKKETAEKIPQGVHTMTFTLPATGLKVGQQLYLRPYMGEQQEQIAVTDEQGQPFGFIPAEHTDYVLSRIESHSMTHMTVTQIDEDGTQIQLSAKANFISTKPREGKISFSGFSYAETIRYSSIYCSRSAPTDT